MGDTNHCHNETTLVFALQADKDDARSQLASTTAELEASKQQLAATDTTRSQAEAALQELQALHDTLAAENASAQAKV